MLTRLGRLAVRYSRAVLIGVLLLFIGLGVYGAGAQDDLDLSRWSAPGTESVRAGDLLRDDFGTGNPNLALLVTAGDGDVDSSRTERAGRELAAEVGRLPLVTDVTSYWDADSPALRGEDGRHALILARLEGTATETREELVTLSPRLTRTTADLDVRVGGQEEISRQVGQEARSDFLRAEAFALPAVLLLLILVYRRTTAALLTIAVGLLSVVATLAGLRAIAQVTEVSTFAANIALVLGLGLGVDYSLFVINRYREERAAGHAQQQAVVRATAVAGRTVVFSGVTVAVSLCALLVFPFFFLSSFAYAGVLVVLSAIGGAVILLPAALARWATGSSAPPRRPPASGTAPPSRPCAAPSWPAPASSPSSSSPPHPCSACASASPTNAPCPRAPPRAPPPRPSTASSPPSPPTPSRSCSPNPPTPVPTPPGSPVSPASSRSTPPTAATRTAGTPAPPARTG
ncbi:MMPL family transporter [Streptomyces lincolnensis]|uniref:MMPL family transporter n=1 Tax=Streptomyces lincolnensis TaxID=1915 RepID=UPI001E4A9509|nr:MMPL family transporter [Streptomyces lincolnensis]